MRTRFLRIVPFPAMPLGNFRSLPTEVGTAAPIIPVAGPRPLIHPQEMSLTVAVGSPPLEPLNGSTLAPVCLLGSPSAQELVASSGSDDEF